MRYLKLLFGTVVISFLIVPLLAILPLAFTSGTFLNYPMQGLSFRWFEQLWISDHWQRAIINTLVIGLASSALATVLGVLASLGLRRRRGVFYNLLQLVFLLPMVAPIVVLGVGMQILFAQLELTNTFAGVIIAHTVISLPFVLISVSSSLAAVDSRLERAAASLGASPVTVFRFVTLPLIRPGIQAGAIFAFATSLDEVVLVLFVGGTNQRTLAREMYAQLRDNVTPVIASASFLFIVGTICLAALAVFLERRRAASTAA
ncbi:ABC transporter permease [Sinorhizobium meliloti]|jgi:putative spermidine/putrescine transport system permease protein|nr:ABC transporter permease [Sinorhizobium meliloti]CCM69626.1 binding-protein-dependent transport systems inner membrane component [Sinorhizobium meliloti Rm41]ASP83105.1 polyamine ABC transporter permease [Sinorhizobium meliloti]MQV24902.1 ABC transporter permease subunit [Sinorhizobium meliloti]MQV37428.1 ABC transporter permease subunit [Sinorhizobium meliloti]MQW20079.1 ABC transporter permease subunit [Sinorhizobium meliloti]